MNYISVIVPLFNENDDIINNLVKNLIIHLNKITQDWKIILVDDGSTNNSWETIMKITNDNKNIAAIKLYRNFGQHCAIKAGLDNSNSKFTIVMDGDMQDNPKYIQQLYEKIKNGFDVVYCERYKRKDLIQNFFSRIFYSLFNFLSQKKLNQKIANFCIFSEKLLEELKKNKLTHISFFASIKSFSTNEGFIKTTRDSRLPGSTPAYSFKNRFKLAKNTIISFSDRLLYLAVIIGMIFFIISIMSVIYLVINKIFLNPNDPVIGWTSLVTIILFSFGLTNLSIGIFGLYINSIHNILKTNNAYLINKKINLN